MKNLLLSVLILGLFVGVASAAEVVKLKDKTIDVNLDNAIYSEVYFGNVSGKYSLVVRFKPFSEKLYNDWQSWNSGSSIVKTDLGYLGKVDNSSGELSLNREYLKIGLSGPSKFDKQGTITISGYGLDEAQWMDLKTQFELYNDSNSKYDESAPKSAYYIRK